MRQRIAHYRSPLVLWNGHGHSAGEGASLCVLVVRGHADLEEFLDSGTEGRSNRDAVGDRLARSHGDGGVSLVGMDDGGHGNVPA